MGRGGIISRNNEYRHLPYDKFIYNEDGTYYARDDKNSNDLYGLMIMGILILIFLFLNAFVFRWFI